MVSPLSPNNPYKNCHDGSAEEWEAHERVRRAPSKPEIIPAGQQVIDGAQATDEIITEVRRFLVLYMQRTLSQGTEKYPREQKRDDWRCDYMAYLRDEDF